MDSTRTEPNDAIIQKKKKDTYSACGLTRKEFGSKLEKCKKIIEALGRPNGFHIVFSGKNYLRILYHFCNSKPKLTKKTPYDNFVAVLISNYNHRNSKDIFQKFNKALKFYATR